LHASTKLLHTFRSIASSNRFVSSVSEISFLTLSNHRCRGLPLGRFFVGFRIRTFRMTLTLARQTWPATIIVLLLRTNRYWVCYITFLVHRSFVSHIPQFDFAQVRKFSVRLFFQRWVASLRPPVLWTMSRMHTLQSVSAIAYFIFL
jgi:hypothetical protein